MGRGPGQGRRAGEVQGIGVEQARPALGQDPGLVEGGVVGLGQALQPGAGLDQHPPPEQARGRRHLDGGNRQAQGAGTGDDQHGGGPQHGLAHRQAQGPADDEGQGCSDVDHRHIDGRRLVGELDVGRPRLGARLHQPGDPRQGRVLAGRLGAKGQEAGQVEGARPADRAGGHRLGRGLAGQDGVVELGLPGLHHPVHGDPLPRPDPQPVAGPDQAQGRPPLGPVLGEEGGRGRLEGQEVGGGAPGPPPEGVVHPPADQQQEEQGDGGVEIGVPALQQGLLEADQQGQDHADRDRHVHIGPPRPQGVPGRAEEDHAGEDGAGRADPGAGPLHEGAGRRSQLLAEQAGPDRHGEDHGVSGAEAGDGQGHGQFAALAVLGLPGRVRIEGRGGIADAVEDAQDPAGVALRLKANGQAAGAQVEPGRGHAGGVGQLALDPGDAGRAMGAADQEVEPPGARPGLGQVGGQVRAVGAGLRHAFRPGPRLALGQGHVSLRAPSKAPSPPRASKVRSQAPAGWATGAS